MTGKELYDKYLSDLNDLQEKCPHNNESDWMAEYWAPGHGTGRSVKVCLDCNKTIDTTPPISYVINDNEIP